ncbi:hypothetical protein PSEUDO9AZ_11252 [Pseudomonas sp. 9AZ]|nr:hypothetical protein PSEUDO9AZ_11252 [Pseudomonas sp. 9AZ]
MSAHADSVVTTAQSEPLSMKTSHNKDFQMICVSRQLGNPAKDMAARHARCC